MSRTALSRAIGIITAILLVLARPTKAQCPGQWLDGAGVAGINGTVNAMVVWDPDGSGPRQPLLVVGGSFNLAGAIATTNIAAWDGTAWTAEFGTGLAQLNSTAVLALTVFNGDLIAAFQPSFPAPYSHRAVHRWTGSTWEAVGNNLWWSATSFTVLDGTLYAAGYLNPNNGPTIANQIVRLDGDGTWRQVGTVTFDGAINALTSYNGQLIAGGAFLYSSGSTSFLAYVAAWNGTSWSQLGNGYFGPVRALTEFEGSLVAGGPRWPSETANTFVGRWDGSDWTFLGADGIPGDVYSLTLFQGQLMAGGSQYHTLRRWDGAAWQTLSPGFGSVSAMAVLGSDLAVGAGASDDTGSRGITLWDGAAARRMGDGVYPGGLSVCAFNGEFVAGAGFATVPGQPAFNIGRLSSQGWLPLGGDLNGVPNALTAGPTALFAGGAFTQAGGLDASNVARWDGFTWSPLGSGVDGAVQSMALLDSDVVVGGVFANAGGQPATNVARWDGAAWHAFGAGIAGGVEALTIYNGDVVAGTFGGSGQPAGMVLRWDGAAWQPIGGGLGSANGDYVKTLTTYNGHLFAGGHFHVPGNTGIHLVAEWDGSAWQSRLASDSSSIQDVWSLHTLDGRLIAGGQFYISALPATNIASWDGTTWTALSAMGVPDRGVFALADLHGELCAAGGFSKIGNIVTVGIARWAGPSSDFNHDGDAGTDADIDAFFACLSGNCCLLCPGADVNGDGDVGTDADIESFFRVLAGAGC